MIMQRAIELKITRLAALIIGILILGGVADLAYAEQRPGAAMDIACRVHAVTQRATHRPQGQPQSAKMASIASANTPMLAELAPTMAASRAI